MPSQKGFSAILLVVSLLIAVLAVGAGAFYLGRQTSSPEVQNSADTQNQINSQTEMPQFAVYAHPKGFSFEYPNKWRPQIESGDIYVHSLDFLEDNVKVMNITIVDSPFDIVRSSYPQAIAVSVDSKQGLKDGNTVLIPLGSGNTSVARITFQRSDYIEHVTSSVKFHEQAKIDDPQHWPVYEDIANSFSFPYPPIFRVEPKADGIEVFYDNPAAAGLEPFVPPNLVLKVVATKTSEKADVYADRIMKERRASFGLSDSGYGLAQDQLDFIPMFKTFVGPKETPWRSVGHYFVNANNSVIEIIAYEPNTETLKLNNMNILQYVVYKFKFKK